MNQHRFWAVALLAGLSLCSQVQVNGQEPAQGGADPAIQIKPSTVVQQPDAASLLDKASYLIGFNFMTSVKEQRPDANVDQLIEGMDAAASGKDYTSFIAGYRMMENIKSQGVDLNVDQIKVGIQTAVAGKQLGMSEEEVGVLMQAFSNMMEAKEAARLKLESDKNMAAGAAYLEQQKKERPGLKPLENGVFYEVLKEGEGESPKAEETVRIDYTGSFIDGTVFDSTVNPPSGRPPEPAEYLVSGFVPGFSAALQNMKVGSTWRVVIPGPMAYGVRGKPPIGPSQTLVFEISLLDIIK